MKITLDAYAERKKETVTHETFGHLKPEVGRKYKGYIEFAYGTYGDEVIIDASFDGLDDSPWLFDDLQFFLAQNRGTPIIGAFRWEGWYKRFKNGNCQFQVTPLYTVRVG